MFRIGMMLCLVSSLFLATTDSNSSFAQDSGGILEWDVTVDGRVVHAACAGTGDHSVLYEPGGPDSEAATVAVHGGGADISAAMGARFCAYDRAGTGESEPHPMAVRTFEEAADDMLAILASPELACPCVVLGESMGASLSLVAFNRDPTNFAGMVLLDGAYDGFFDDFSAMAPPGSPETDSEFTAVFAGANDEKFDLITSFRQATAPESPATIPVIVVTHGEGNPPPCVPECSPEFPIAELEAIWQADQSAMADALGGQLVVADGTGHFITQDNPDFAIAQVVAVISAISGVAPPAAEASAVAETIADGMIDVGGRSLHYACAGTGSPTVLLEPGGPMSDGGAAIINEYGEFLATAFGSTFCSYDRAGSGQSDPHPTGVHSLADSASDLIRVLAAPELACPCVVIGESLGGAISLIAYDTDPSGFAGYILLDAAYPGVFGISISLAPSGSVEAGAEWVAYNEGENEEQLDVTAGFTDAEVTLEPATIPVVVITHGAEAPPPCTYDSCSDAYPVDELEILWQAGQVKLAADLGARLVVAKDTSHYIADENMSLVVGTVVQVIAGIADPESWATPAAGDPVADAMAAAGITEFSVAIENRAIHLACAGSGGPTVLYEAGGPDPGGGTQVVVAIGSSVSGTLGTRFCAYDRAGTGQSDPAPAGVRTFQDSANDLIALLASPELDCPCVIIGESMGGSIALVAHQTDDSNIAGLVLLDAAYPGYFDDLVGLAPVGTDEAADGALMTYASGENEELLDLATGFRQVEHPTEPATIPIIVVTHGAGNPPPCNPTCSETYPTAELETKWQAGQIAMATALGAKLIVAEGVEHGIGEADLGLMLEVTADVISAVVAPDN